MFEGVVNRARDRRSGQVVLVMAFVLLVMIALVLMNVDFFVAARSKNRVTDAGDAAALAGARWQGLTLNLIGKLNLLHLEAACKYADDPQMSSNICAGISALQERLAVAGPLMGCYDANRAAMLNGVGEFEETRVLTEEVAMRAVYLPATDTWPDKPHDYSMMIKAAFSGGAFACVDNANLYWANLAVDHPLYNRSFYQAIIGEDWCWFFFRDGYMGLLRNFTGWDPVPPVSFRDEFHNSELLGCSVVPRTGWAFLSLPDITDILLDIASRHSLPSVNEETLGRGIFGLPADDEGHRLPCALGHEWWFYDTGGNLSGLYGNGDWREWFEMDIAGENRMPLVSEVKDEYYVFGASSVMRVYDWIAPVTPGVHSNLNYWTAAAKPFGCRSTPYGTCAVTQYDPTAGVRPFPLVTPDFSDVRLIPLAGASERRLGTSDLEWMRHICEHVSDCARGMTFDDCPYCDALRKWSSAAFRHSGVSWLLKYSGTCKRPTHGPGGAGGTRHAH